jgi:adenylylsulfate kinase
MTRFFDAFDEIITYKQRKDSMNQEPHLIWFTGLSGAGKTTLAQAIELHLFSKGLKVVILDGDIVRKGLCNDLGYSEDDRKENLRRVREVAKLMLDAGLVVICAFISPSAEDRRAVKELVGAERFTEVYVKCTVNVCEKRDVKGLYAKARKGLIPNFTGISAAYDEPVLPDIVIDTQQETVQASVMKLLNLIEPVIRLDHPTLAH